MGDEARAYEWVEPLPAGCPPDDAWPPDGDKTYYRLVASVPPIQEDFYSHRKLYPDRPFRGSECIARACSLLETLGRCAEVMAMPQHKDKGERIVRITLPPDSGVVKNTGPRHHVSWWWAKGFDPVACCEEL